jgi:sugar O-acyltransferase (sialic acid O-acetyltransferase NeuD family)
VRTETLAAAPAKGEQRVENLVIYGNGPVATTIYHGLVREVTYEIRAFTVDRQLIESSELLGLPVVPFDEVECACLPADHRMLVAVGYTKTNHLRAERYRQARAKGYSLIAHVSPKATVEPGVTMGDNCLIGDNTVIQPDVTIGSDVLVRDNIFIGHGSTIGDHCYIGSGAVILGRATIGDYTLIGANATVKDGVTVGYANAIGAGVTLLTDTGEKEVYMNRTAQRLPLSSDQLD